MRYPCRQRGMEELGAGGAHVIDTYLLLGGRTELNEIEIVSRGNFTQVFLDPLAVFVVVLALCFGKFPRSAALGGRAPAVWTLSSSEV